MIVGLMTGAGFLFWLVLVYYNKAMDQAMDNMEQSMQEQQRQQAQTTTTMTDPEGTQIIIKRRRIRTK